MDYSLSPEAPFPRALEECFYAYCWALRNSHLLGRGHGLRTLLRAHLLCHSLFKADPWWPLLQPCFKRVQLRVSVAGSTAERVCLAGDSAGGNLCITVSMKALSSGVRVPDGIMAAYPATLLTTDASPSRLLTLIDPFLPLGVLTKCLNAYAGDGPPGHGHHLND